MPDLIIMELNVDMTSQELEALVVATTPIVVARSGGLGAYALIDGYNDDPRPLWQIQEVAELCQRAIDAGILFLLATEHRENGKLINVFWLYALAKGLLHSDVSGGAALVMTSGILDDLKAAVRKSTEKAEGLLKAAESKGEA